MIETRANYAYKNSMIEMIEIVSIGSSNDRKCKHLCSIRPTQCGVFSCQVFTTNPQMQTPAFFNLPMIEMIENVNILCFVFLSLLTKNYAVESVRDPAFLSYDAVKNFQNGKYP